MVLRCARELRYKGNGGSAPRRYLDLEKALVFPTLPLSFNRAGRWAEWRFKVKMVVHVFGATSYPSCTVLCLLKTAEDNQNEFPAGIVCIVRRNFYVDDCLKSLKTPQEAKTVVKELIALLSRGGFRLTKWISNDREVLESIPQSERAASVVHLALDEIPVERTLEIQWNVAAEKFCFKVVAKEKPLTRHGVLSVASSLYDPLGFVAPFTLS